MSKRRNHTFNHDSFLQSLDTTLASLSSSRHYLIAFSGGLDSHVLLDALARLRIANPTIQLRAIHIHHGLQNVADDWVEHCCNICSALDIAYQCIQLSLNANTSESLEALARKHRYQAFADVLQPNECLLTAHHQNDQAETLLLQLFRGSGVNGLAAMPQKATFAQGEHLRPLLHINRDALEQYAEYYQLNHIEDPSNQDDRFDRNFLRLEVMPLLEQRWPSINATLSRAANFQAEAKYLIDQSIEALFQQLYPQASSQKSHSTLALVPLLERSYIEQKALIRYWINLNGFPCPSATQLESLFSTLIPASADANPVIEWENTEIRRFNQQLYIMKPLPETVAVDHLAWKDINQPLYIDSLDITLEPSLLTPYKAILEQHANNVYISTRKGGEKIKLRSNQPTQTLKKLFQTHQIPPWERNRVPLIFADETLIVVYPWFRMEANILLNPL